MRTGWSHNLGVFKPLVEGLNVFDLQGFFKMRQQLSFFHTNVRQEDVSEVFQTPVELRLIDGMTILLVHLEFSLASNIISLHRRAFSPFVQSGQVLACKDSRHQSSEPLDRSPLSKVSFKILAFNEPLLQQRHVEPTSLQCH